jgi:hypothetical protein
VDGTVIYIFIKNWKLYKYFHVHKETFLECRVDGRLLNLLTVDDLCYLRVSSLLHHCSIRRGIQVPEQAEIYLLAGLWIRIRMGPH